MTPRERFHATMDGKKPDRFFRYELGAWPSTIKKWKTQGMPEDADFNAHFGMDPFFRLPFATGYTDSPLYPRFERKTLTKGAGWEIVKDSDGIVKKVLSADGDLSMPQFLEFPMKSGSDWPALESRLDPANVPKLLGDVAPVALKLSQMPDVPVVMTICGGFGHPRNLMGDEALFYAMFDEPELIRMIIANWLALYKSVIDFVCGAVKVDCMLIWEDMCYRNGPLIGPGHFTEFILPSYTDLISHAKSRGIDYVWVDTDGDVRKLLPLFLAAGVDALLPFEVQAGMDVVSIRKEYGGSFTIIGGIDKRVLAGDRGGIKAEVDRVLPFFTESGRYIPTLDHTAPVNVPYENFLYYLECVREYE